MTATMITAIATTTGQRWPWQQPVQQRNDDIDNYQNCYKEDEGNNDNNNDCDSDRDYDNISNGDDYNGDNDIDNYDYDSKWRRQRQPP